MKRLIASFWELKPVRLTVAFFVVLYKRIPYIMIATLALMVIIYGGIFVSRGLKDIYYRFAPASHFIQITKQPFITNGSVDGTLTLTFCRNTTYDNIHAIGFRSFYQIVSGNEQPAGDYQFQATIERNKECQYIPITADKHPRKAGTYKSHTDLTFVVEGHKKVLGYDTNGFVISDTAKSLEQQIQDLQNQILELQGKLGTASPTSAPIASTRRTTTQQSATSTPAITIQPSSGNSTPTPPVVTAPPYPNVLQTLLTVTGQQLQGAVNAVSGIL